MRISNVHGIKGRAGVIVLCVLCSHRKGKTTERIESLKSDTRWIVFIMVDTAGGVEVGSGART